MAAPNTAENTNKSQLLWAFLFFAWFSGTIQLLLLVSGKASGIGLKNALIYSLPWLIVPLWLHRYARPWMLMTGLSMALCGLIKLGYFLMYGQEISQSIFYVIFDSNMHEGSEFFQNYFRAWMLPVFMAYLAIPAWMWMRYKPASASGKQRLWLSLLIALTVVEPLLSHKTLALGWNSLVKRQESVAPWDMLINYNQYQKNIASVENILANLNTIDIGEISSRDDNPEQTYVLVIGESTNRQRMSLYGYSRNTSPELTSLGDEINAFNDVNAAVPYTIESIVSAFYFTDRSEISKTFDTQANLIMLMKKLGFSVFWITNQQTITSRNTLLTTFSKMADKAWYLNNNRVQSSSQTDEIVLAPFDEALANPAPKKLIVVHLLGTHFSYRFRYPASFDQFHDAPPTDIELSSGDATTYNEYDNAVLYNDYVVASLIKRMKSTNPYGFLVYFSDHGEEVFDSIDFNGRDALAPTSAMYTVPFIVWGSPEWKARHNTSQWSHWYDRPYSLDDFVHTWCDLAAIEYAQCQQEKSLINDRFIADSRKRTHPWLRNTQQAQQGSGARPGA